jgi:GABA(A) receptor-associated protein
MNSFRERYSYEKRIEEFNRLKIKHPDRLPIIVEKFTGDKHLPSLPKTKFLLQGNTTMGQLLYTVRCNLGMQLKPSIATFLFINNILPPSNMKLKEIYDIYKEPDGFLYIIISAENTFG